MDEKELAALKERFDQPGEQIENGLCNINRRLKIRFGNEYGIEILSRKGKGTLCSLILPAGREEGRNPDVQSAGSG